MPTLTASATADETHATLALLLFRLADQLVGVASDAVREVARFRPFTPIPGAPNLLPGIISMRGTIVPVIDVRSLLGLSTPPPSRAARLVLLRIDETDCAVYADSVLDLGTIEATSVAPTPPATDHERTAILRGIAPTEHGSLALIDLPGLLLTIRRI